MELREEAAAFATAESRAHDYRRIAGIGPAYEVIGNAGDYVRIRMVEDGEELDYPRADFDADPPA